MDSVLKDSELLYERGIYPQSTYLFKHALTQEVAYNSLLLKKRKEIHEEIGKAIEVLYPDRLEEHYELLAYHYACSANTDKAVEYLDLANQKAAELAEASGNVEEAGYAYVFLVFSHFDRGDFERVLALKEDVLRTMEQRFKLRWHTYALSIAASAYGILGRWDEAVEDGQKALSVAEEFSDNSLISFVAWNISIAYTWKGDLARAVEYGELAVQKAPTPADKAWAQRSLGWAWWRAGQPTRGIELLTAVLPIFRAGGFMASEIDLTCYLGDGYWLAGEDDKARQTLEEGLEMAAHSGTRYYVGFTHRLLGEIALKNNPAQAAPYFEKNIAVLQEIKAENELALAYAGYGRLLKKQGQVAQAREYLTKALEIFERLGTLTEPDKVREELAEEG